MQGLNALYVQTGRQTEWKRLVNEVVPDFVDAVTDAPLTGREEDWDHITEYRARIAEKELKLDEAERLQRARVNWNRHRASQFIIAPSDKLDNLGRGAIQLLGSSLHGLAEIQRKLGKMECIRSYKEALNLARFIGARHHAATTAFNLGNVFLLHPVVRNLDEAEQHFTDSLEQRDEHDDVGRAKCFIHLGIVAFNRFQENRGGRKSEKDLLTHLNAAIAFYNRGLSLLPSNAVDDLAVVCTNLGSIYYEASDFNSAIDYFQRAVHYSELQNDPYRANRVRRNLAATLLYSNRLGDAKEYALAALRNFETLGSSAAAEIQETKRVLALIEQEMRM